jgi:hypothetical protein
MGLLDVGWSGGSASGWAAVDFEDNGNGRAARGCIENLRNRRDAGRIHGTG